MDDVLRMMKDELSVSVSQCDASIVPYCHIKGCAPCGMVVIAKLEFFSSALRLLLCHSSTVCYSMLSVKSYTNAPKLYYFTPRTVIKHNLETSLDFIRSTNSVDLQTKVQETKHKTQLIFCFVFSFMKLFSYCCSQQVAVI